MPDSIDDLTPEPIGSLPPRQRAALKVARSRGGRPPKKTPAKRRQTERVHAASTSVTEIAAALGVGRFTVYWHLHQGANG